MAVRSDGSFGFIYLIRNLVNGKVYVGQTVKTIEQRWRCHVNEARRDPRYPILSAIAKYGEDSFEMTRLARAWSREQLDRLEVRFIAKLKATDRAVGYNLKTGGSTGSLPPESRAAIGAKNRINGLGRRASSETRRRMSESFRARYAAMTREEILAEKSALRGKSRSEEVKRKIGAAHKGKVIPQEMRDRIAASLRGRPLTEETRKKISKALKGRQTHVWTEESRRNASAAGKKRFQNPDELEAHKMRARGRVKLYGVEERERLSVAGRVGAAKRWGKA